VVLEDDEKVLQTGQIFEVIASEMLEQFEAISSVELFSEWLLYFTTNLDFLPGGGRVLSIFLATIGGRPAASTSTEAASKEVSVSIGELDGLLMGTDSSISD
jgi:hypothetical protein